MERCSLQIHRHSHCSQWRAHECPPPCTHPSTRTCHCLSLSLHRVFFQRRWSHRECWHHHDQSDQVSSSAPPLFSLSDSALLSFNHILFRWIGAEDEVLTHPIHSEIRPTVSSPSLELSLRRFHSITLLSFNFPLEVSPS